MPKTIHVCRLPVLTNITLLVVVVLAGCSRSPSSTPSRQAGQPANAKSQNSVAAQPANAPSTEATPAPPIEWLTDLEQAKRVAAIANKDLFICFTGLAWCGPCNQLE